MTQKIKVPQAEVEKDLKYFFLDILNKYPSQNLSVSISSSGQIEEGIIVSAAFLFSKKEFSDLISDAQQEKDKYSLILEKVDEYSGMQFIFTAEPKSFLKKTVRHLLDYSNKNGLITVRLHNFLTSVIESRNENYLTEDLLDELKILRDKKEKMPWRGQEQKIHKELNELLLDLRINKEQLSKYF